MSISYGRETGSEKTVNIEVRVTGERNNKESV
jgi:hypothetical protein